MVERSTASCAHCAITFERRTSHQRFCCDQCKYRDRDRRKSVTGLDRAAYVAARSASAIGRSHFDCQHCGRRASRKLSAANKAAGYVNRFCSLSCRDAARAEAARQASLSMGLSSPCFAAYCTACNAPFVSKREKTMCSRACEVRAAAAATHKSSARVVRCQECECRFCPLYGCGRFILCVVCSDARRLAHRRVARLKRKARERAAKVESVDPIAVLERDGWTCRICGISTPRSKRGSLDDNAPELDHIIPLAAGGEHSYRNTQCACRRCNREKSDSLPEASGVGPSKSLQLLRPRTPTSTSRAEKSPPGGNC